MELQTDQLRAGVVLPAHYFRHDIPDRGPRFASGHSYRQLDFQMTSGRKPA